MAEDIKDNIKMIKNTDKVSSIGQMVDNIEEYGSTENSMAMGNTETKKEIFVKGFGSMALASDGSTKTQLMEQFLSKLPNDLHNLFKVFIRIYGEERNEEEGHLYPFHEHSFHYKTLQEHYERVSRQDLWMLRPRVKASFAGKQSEPFPHNLMHAISGPADQAQSQSHLRKTGSEYHRYSEGC